MPSKIYPHSDKTINLHADFINEINGNRVQHEIENENTSFLLRACYNALIHQEYVELSKIENMPVKQFQRLDFNRHFSGEHIFNGASIFLLSCALNYIYREKLFNRILELPDNLFLCLNFSVSHSDKNDPFRGGNIFLYALGIATSGKKFHELDNRLLDRIAQLNIDPQKLQLTKTWDQTPLNKQSRRNLLPTLMKLSAVVTSSKNENTKNYFYNTLANMGQDEFQLFDFSTNTLKNITDESVKKSLIDLIQSDLNPQRQFQLIKKVLSLTNLQDFMNCVINRDNILFLLKIYYQYETSNDKIDLRTCYSALETIENENNNMPNLRSTVYAICEENHKEVHVTPFISSLITNLISSLILETEAPLYRYCLSLSNPDDFTKILKIGLPKHFFEENFYFVCLLSIIGLEENSPGSFHDLSNVINTLFDKSYKNTFAASGIKLDLDDVNFKLPSFESLPLVVPATQTYPFTITIYIFLLCYALCTRQSKQMAELIKADKFIREHDTKVSSETRLLIGITYYVSKSFNYYERAIEILSDETIFDNLKIDQESMYEILSANYYRDLQKEMLKSTTPEEASLTMEAYNKIKIKYPVIFEKLSNITVLEILCANFCYKQRTNISFDDASQLIQNNFDIFENMLIDSSLLESPRVYHRLVDLIAAECDYLLSFILTISKKSTVLIEKIRTVIKTINHMNYTFLPLTDQYYYQGSRLKFFDMLFAYALLSPYEGYKPFTICNIIKDPHIHLGRPILTNNIIYQSQLFIHYMALSKFYFKNIEHPFKPIKLTNNQINSLPLEIQFLHFFSYLTYTLNQKFGVTKERNEIKNHCLNLIEKIRLNYKNPDHETMTYFADLSQKKLNLFENHLNEMQNSTIKTVQKTNPIPVINDELLLLLRKYFSDENIFITSNASMYSVKAVQTYEPIFNLFEKIIIKSCTEINIKNCFTVLKLKTEVAILISFKKASKASVITYLKKNNLLQHFFKLQADSSNAKTKSVEASTHFPNLPETHKQFQQKDQQEIYDKCKKFRFGGNVITEMNENMTVCTIKITFLKMPDTKPVILQLKKKTCYSVKLDDIKQIAERLQTQLGLTINEINHDEINFSLAISNFDLFSDVSIEKSILEPLHKIIEDCGEKITLTRTTEPKTQADLPQNPLPPTVTEPAAPKITPIENAKALFHQLLPSINPECRWLNYQMTRKNRHYFTIKLDKEGKLAFENRLIPLASLLMFLASNFPDKKIIYIEKINQLSIEEKLLSELLDKPDLFNIIKSKIDTWIEKNAVIKNSDPTIPVMMLPQKDLTPMPVYRKQKHILFHPAAPDIIPNNKSITSLILDLKDIIKRKEDKSYPFDTKQGHHIYHYGLIFHLLRFFECTRHVVDENIKVKFTDWRHKLMHRSALFSEIEIPELAKRIINHKNLAKNLEKIDDLYFAEIDLELDRSKKQLLEQIDHAINQFVSLPLKQEWKETLNAPTDIINAASMLLNIIGEAVQQLKSKHQSWPAIANNKMKLIPFLKKCKFYRDSIAHKPVTIESERFAIIELIPENDIFVWHEKVSAFVENTVENVINKV